MKDYNVDDMLDPEWLEIIMEARALGLSISEIREFIHQKMTA